MRRLLILSLLLVPHVGCDDSNPQFWQGPNDLLQTENNLLQKGTLPFIPLDDRIAYVERNSQTAFLLNPADPSLKPSMVPVCKAPVLAVKRNGTNQTNQMLLLCSGDSGSSTVKAVAPQLQVIDGATAASRLYPLVGRYDGLAQSEDGRFAVLFHKSSQTTTNSGLFNPNEMTIVDFNTPTATSDITTTPKSIRSLGGSPQSIKFASIATFPSGRAREVAVVLSQNYVTVFDLANPTEDEISVPLCAQSTGCIFNTEEIQFEAVPADGAPAVTQKINVYVRASKSSDIFQIAVTEATDDTTHLTTLHASLSMLSVGASPDAMLLYGSGSTARLAVLSSTSSKLVIIDPNTSHALSMPTAIPANVIVPFTVGTGATAKNQALLVDTIHNNPSVLFADLSQVETSGGLAIKDYPLSAAATQVWRISSDIVVLVAARSGATTAFTVMAMSSKSSTDIAGDNQLGPPTFETTGTARMWSSYKGSGLTYLNLSRDTNAALATNLIWLDQNIEGIVPLPQKSTDGKRYLAAAHRDAEKVGNITFLDADAPDNTTARTAYGFLYTNYLKRAQP